MNEGALAATARPADGHEFMPRDLQRNAGERVHGALAARIVAGQILERDKASFTRQRVAWRKPARLQNRRGERRLHRRRQAAVSSGSSDEAEPVAHALGRAETIARV